MSLTEIIAQFDRWQVEQDEGDPGHSMGSPYEECAKFLKEHADEAVAAASSEAVTASKIQDALFFVRYNGNWQEAAKELIGAACISKKEIDAVLTDPADRERLYPFCFK